MQQRLLASILFMFAMGIASVEIPVNLTNKQKSILKEFEKEGGTSKTHSPKSGSFFEKIKEVWEDIT